MPAPNSGASARFEFNVPTTGRYEVRVAWSPHENRSSKTPCTVEAAEGVKTFALEPEAKARARRWIPLARRF